ncbi:hypothetical protein QUF88_25870 [Bacillus sp. DX1.1]|uniref:hypothetical protein n=1 Tax=Bacillus sp. DX3.1 TaxID=3052091 RepID=UPI0025712290|nr:hypothetical protein [Bacillus sp. DX3.1]MDM5157116.1 hypothetical protein [Bacillus sp. DX1.1]WJE81351.1 hypothetical protein QRE67_23410 [Bacillus sp. DX3.1]
MRRNAEAARLEQEGVGTPDIEAHFASQEGVKRPTVLAAGTGHQRKAEPTVQPRWLRFFHTEGAFCLLVRKVLRHERLRQRNVEAAARSPYKIKRTAHRLSFLF